MSPTQSPTPSPTHQAASSARQTSQTLLQTVAHVLREWKAALVLFLLIIGFMFATFFTVFSISLSLSFLGFVSGLGLLATIPVWPSRFGWLQVAVATTSLVALALFFDRPAQELQARLDVMGDTVRSEGANSWTSGEVLGARMLSRVMAWGGTFMGYPEVAREHGEMEHAGPSVRSFRSVFPRESKTLYNLVCRKDDVDTRLLFADDSPRWSLAYNGGWLKTTHGQDTVDVNLTIAIRYRVDSHSPLFVARGIGGGKHTFVVDEGVFNGLVQLGHLHNYTAIWNWRVPNSVCSRRARG